MASDLDPATLAGRLRSMAESVRSNLRGGGSDDGEERSLSLIEAVQSPEQRAIMNRLTAVMTLLEGHGEYVMNGVGSQVIPTVAEIGERFRQRRRGGNPADRLVRKLFGLDMKARQYADGSAFVCAVVDEAGMAGFNRVWTSPNTLPTRAEIAEPELWLKRVLRPKAISQGPHSPPELADPTETPDDGGKRGKHHRSGD
jgi:coenzyme F420 biosynthesis associated uncharacterized protein